MARMAAAYHQLRLEFLILDNLKNFRIFFLLEPITLKSQDFGSQRGVASSGWTKVPLP